MSGDRLLESWAATEATTHPGGPDPTRQTFLDGHEGDEPLIRAGYGCGRLRLNGAGLRFQITIIERPDAPGVIDAVQFGATVTRDALRISRDGEDLVIDLGNGVGRADHRRSGLGHHGRVEEFRFGDGSVP